MATSVNRAPSLARHQGCAPSRAQGQWIKDNTIARNIRYVIHEGDIVDDSDQPRQWTNADSALGRLDGNTPYILGVGNHDRAPWRLMR